MPASGDPKVRAIRYGLVLLAASAAFVPITGRWSRVNQISTTLLVFCIQVPLLLLECGAFACLLASGGKRWALIAEACLAIAIIMSGLDYLTRAGLR
jgi:hypothetical protein